MPTTIRAMSSIAFVRCHSSRRNRQIQARPSATTRIERKSQPPSRATSGLASRRLYLSIVSSCSAVTLSPRRTIASLSSTWTVWGSTLGGGPLPGGVGQVRAEERVRDDRAGSMIVGGERPLVVGRGRPPSGRSGGPGRPRRRARGARRSRSRRGPATPPPGPPPTAPAVRPRSVDPDLGRDALERSGEEAVALLLGRALGERLVDRRTRWSNEPKLLLGDLDRARGRVVVLGIDLLAGRRLELLRCGRRSRTRAARGATMSAVATLPTSISERLREDVDARG